MRDRRITQQHRNFCYTQSFFIQQIFSMLHSLALIKIKDGSAKHFFKPFFQVTFIDSNLTAKFLNGDRLANMLNQDLSCLCYFITISFISKKLTVYYIDLFFTQHAI